MACRKVTGPANAGQPCAILSAMCSRYFLDADGNVIAYTFSVPVHDRIRKRFNQRFNAVAPSWEDDLQRGRSLLDYPSVVAHLQSAWPEPLDAMAELENLLFRKHGGELFELPAYGDVLSLYAVARDLHRHVDEADADVDVRASGPNQLDDFRREGGIALGYLPAGDGALVCFGLVVHGDAADSVVDRPRDASGGD